MSFQEYVLFSRTEIDSLVSSDLPLGIAEEMVVHFEKEEKRLVRRERAIALTILRSWKRHVPGYEELPKDILPKTRDPYDLRHLWAPSLLPSY